MKKARFAIIVAIVVVVVIVAIVLGVVLTRKDEDESKGSVSSLSTASPPVTTAKPENEAYQYAKAAVATDAAVCSKIGSDTLKRNGSAVDAAVASLFCAGVVNLHSTGIGGGGFMVIYNRQARKAEIYNYRETAPANASERMYLKNGTSSTRGGLGVAVPGEVLGLHTVWKKYGKLPWASLIEPSIKLMKGGFPLPSPLAKAMKSSSSQDKIRNDPGLRKLLMVNGQFKKEGDNLTNPELAKTFEIIKNNPFDFYNGTLAQQIVDDIRNSSGIITLKDLKDYTVNITEPVMFKFKQLDLHSMPPPGSGAVLAMILNIIQGYPNQASDLNTNAKAVKVFHRLIESFKWGYARRALLGDPNFVPIENITRALDQMTNITVGDLIRKNKIKMNMTFNESYYGGYYGKDDFGTSHVSVLAENGDAVSVTGTINYLFGTGYRSLKNGIIYNNEMDDFSTPGKANLYGYMPTEANYIRPGKRPLSSMCPAIITDQNGDVKMIAGASGGSRIITGTAQAIINKLLFNLKLGPSVANPRVHHQLLPNQVYANQDYFVGKPIVNGLKAIGHKVVNTTSFSVVQAIYKESSSKIFAISDPRKKGKPAGY